MCIVQKLPFEIKQMFVNIFYDSNLFINIYLLFIFKLVLLHVGILHDDKTHGFYTVAIYM